MSVVREAFRLRSRGGSALLHWHLYVFEGIELAVFMFSACAFSVVFLWSGSPVVAVLPSPFARQVLFAVILGAVATGIIKSPLGKRSGAHFNPACTITYLALGRIAPRDAAGYIVGQFVGAIAGVGVAAVVFGSALAAPGVDYAASVPGVFGVWGALVAELVMAVGFMTVALWTTNDPRLSRWTAALIGALIAVYLVVFGPVSGVGLNPARTVGSAVFADVWTALWLYLTAPVAGMLIAAVLFVRFARRPDPVLCAKLAPDPATLCPFPCRYPGHRHTWEHREPVRAG